MATLKIADTLGTDVTTVTRQAGEDRIERVAQVEQTGITREESQMRRDVNNSKPT